MTACIPFLYFAARYPAVVVCQETTLEASGFSPQQESAGARGRQPPPPPVQETQPSGSQTPLRRSSAAQDELDRDCANKEVSSRSSTGGEAQREAQPQALPNQNTLQSSRYVTRKSLKQQRGRRDLLENIQEEMSPLLDGDKCHSGGVGNLKRTPSTASTVSHDSSRSSGYYSNPRTSYLRLSTADSIAENDDYDGPLNQTRRDSVEDEGVVMDHSSKFRAESPESSGTESSSPPSSPSKSDETTILATKEQDDLQPILRGRCNQITPTHKRRQLPKQTDVLYDDFSSENGEMRRRSSSLPTTTRTRCVKAQPMHMHGVTSPHSQSHSSSTSLDSETTYGSQSEQSSMNGSQLSIASAASGMWLIYLLHG